MLRRMNTEGVEETQPNGEREHGLVVRENPDPCLNSTLQDLLFADGPAPAKPKPRKAKQMPPRDEKELACFLEARKMFGNRWVTITAYMQAHGYDRTERAVRSHAQRTSLAESGYTRGPHKYQPGYRPQMCRTCNQPRRGHVCGVPRDVLEKNRQHNGQSRPPPHARVLNLPIAEAVVATATPTGGSAASYTWVGPSGA